MRTLALAALAAFALVCPRAAFAQAVKSNITATTCTGSGGGSVAQEAGCVVANFGPAYAGVGVQVEGTFVATLVFEVSSGNGTWFQVGGATAPGWFPVQIAGAAQFRVRATSFTSGPVTVTLLPVLGVAGGAQDVVTAATTISAQCATPASGCTGTAGSYALIKVAGRNSVIATVVTANFTGTLQAYLSADNGATFVLTQTRADFGRLSQNSGAANSAAYAANTGTSYMAVLIPMAGVTDVMIASTAAVTNTATVSLVASNASGNPWPQLISIKGTQANAVSSASALGLGVQELKDAGRSAIILNVDAATPANTDTVLTFQKNVDGTATGSLTHHEPTSGKIYRIQSIAASYVQSGATAAKVDVRFRYNTAGNCAAGSGLVASCELGPPGFGTSAANTGSDHCAIPIPDGWEITGNGTRSICVSAIASTSAGTLSVNVFGYEY